MNAHHSHAESKETVGPGRSSQWARRTAEQEAIEQSWVALVASVTLSFACSFASSFAEPAVAEPAAPRKATLRGAPGLAHASRVRRIAGRIIVQTFVDAHHSCSRAAFGGNFNHHLRRQFCSRWKKTVQRLLPFQRIVLLTAAVERLDEELEIALGAVGESEWR